MNLEIATYGTPAYAGEISGEERFELGGRTWQYCWGQYSKLVNEGEGGTCLKQKRDIAVYNVETDLCVNYAVFARMFGII